jgi:C4-dicarboxylate transporter, DctQ subunit
MLETIDKNYTRLLRGMAAIAALYLGLMMAAIIYSVIFRSLGFEYSSYSFVFIEYGFIYTLMLGAPWLVRQRGHVYIEIVTAAVSERVRNILSRAVAALCCFVCLVLAFYAGALALEDYVMGELDVRGSRDIPRWIVTAAMPIGFGLMSVEFLRFVFGRELMHTGQAGVHE